VDEHRPDFTASRDNNLKILVTYPWELPRGRSQLRVYVLAFMTRQKTLLQGQIIVI
jgi:hypothetical protein